MTTIAFKAETKHQGQTLTAGAADRPASCYAVSVEAAAFFVQEMGWAEVVEVDQAAAVDMTHLTAEPGSIRYSDGTVVVPADISASAE